MFTSEGYNYVFMYMYVYPSQADVLHTDDQHS